MAKSSFLLTSPYNLNAFSIAEAMVTLLIVSLALAAMAPIMSKQMKKSVDVQAIPSGAVMFFELRNCPSGWSPVNNSWNNHYLKITNDVDNIGIPEVDGLPNITGTALGAADWQVTTSPVSGAFLWDSTKPVSIGYGDKGQGTTSGYEITMDASRSSAVYGRSDEVRPKNIPLLACIKN